MKIQYTPFSVVGEDGWTEFEITQILIIDLDVKEWMLFTFLKSVASRNKDVIHPFTRLTYTL